jgi:hypothetical protein
MDRQRRMEKKGKKKKTLGTESYEIIDNFYKNNSNYYYVEA